MDKISSISNYNVCRAFRFSTSSSAVISATSSFLVYYKYSRCFTFCQSIRNFDEICEYDGLHKDFQQHDEPNVPYICRDKFQLFAVPPLYSRLKKLRAGHHPPILSRRKVDSQSGRFSSAQKQAKEQPNRPAQSQIAGSSIGAIRTIRPPTEAVRRHPAMQQSFTFMRYPHAS